MVDDDDTYERLFFSTALHRVLVNAGITPTELALRLKETPTTVFEWLHGRVPRAQSLVKVAKAIGIRDNEEELHRLFSAAVVNQFIRAAYSPERSTEDSFTRAVHGYFASLKVGLNISEEDYRQLFAVWSSVLPGEAEQYRDETGSASSELVVLPAPPLVVVSEWRDVMNQLRKGTLNLADLGWRQFEDLVARLLENFGWEVTPMGYTKDDGIDIIAARRVAPDVRFNMMVQCKRFAPGRKVGIEIVREVWAVKWQKGFNQAMIATTSAFTRGAQRQGVEWSLELRDRDAILAWCSQLGEITLVN